MLKRKSLSDRVGMFHRLVRRGGRAPRDARGRQDGHAHRMVSLQVTSPEDASGMPRPGRGKRHAPPANTSGIPTADLKVEVQR